MRIHIFSCLLLMFLFRFLDFGRVCGQCIDNQRSLLLQLKTGLVFDPASSNKLVNWNNQSVDCCKWDGIACDNSGYVIGLDLDNESISSGVENSEALFSLQHLEKLNLAFNSFNSSLIPKGLENLTNLAYLNLSNAGFGGQVPIEVSRIRNLVSLDLSTLFPGIVPLRLENPNLKMLVQNLTGLRELYLDNVNISAQGSDWGQALSSSSPNLRNLSMRSCQLSGPLDSSLSQLHSLSVLRLDRNNLSTVPGFFANFSNLVTLTLSSCSLEGPFPESIFQVPTLQTLDLSSNTLLNGRIPQFPQTSSLKTMVLSYTNFSGSLPDSISNLQTLSRIELSNCAFTGSIPSSMANLTELVHLDFSFNSFNGSIPLFHMSKKLSYIDLSRNFLTGPLSSMHFDGLSSLAYINMASNLLSGSIPQSLLGLPSLQKLLLSNNKFSGQVDEFSTSNLSNLDTLDLSSNKLEGSIPESFFGLKRLNVLSLSSNFFNGTVKLESIQMLQNLTRLELGHNNLSVDASSNISSLSSFPQLSRLNLASCQLSDFPDLRNQSRLVVLDLSNNHITGEIPNWIWSIGDGQLLHLNLSYNLLVDLQKPFDISSSFLGVLDLHSNRLRGEFPMPPASASYVDYSSNNFQQSIPIDIGNFTSYAMFFSLANNSLTGMIPPSLCNAIYLQVLDLSSNNFNGSIPSCLLENIPSLGVLNLGRNDISGDIPDTFSVNCSLKTLDLSSNNIGGNVPLSLANCKSLEVMNVGNNNLDDTFPCMLKNSSSLRVLVLRNNKFHGKLGCPGDNGNWSNLQIIDIASNDFSGELYPRCISSWKGMMLDNDEQSGHNHLRFDFLGLSNFYYQDTVTVTMKGLEMELVKILTVFTAIDFSSNNLSGEIPGTIGDLSSLYVLNFSHNTLTGVIPNSVGNLKQLGSLDLSTNRLTEQIPQELTSLTFLSFLNLSYNQLVGMIPTGSQFQTFSASSFAGNPGLCGFPLNTSCDSNGSNSKSTPGLKRAEFDWRFIFTGVGYGFGAALVIAPLAFCRQWREQCNEYLDLFLKLIFPRYGFSYVRYDSKVEAMENIEDEMSDDDDDDDEDYDREDDIGGGLSRGRYCIFCTKLDIQLKRAIHNPNCTCHYSPPTFASPPTTSSSSSLLVIY